MIIKNAYGHNFKTEENIADTFTMIPHFFYEFNGREDIVYILMSGAKNAELDRIKSVINSYPDNYTVIFDYLYEGFTELIYKKIYDLVELIPNLANRCYYINGAVNNQTIHEEFCRKFDITTPIKTYSCTSWEYYSKKEADISVVLRSMPKEYLIKKRDKLFLNMNRVLRVHRLVMTALIAEDNLLDRGYISFFPDGSHSGDSGFNFLYYSLPLIIGKEHGERIQKIYKKHEHKFPLKLTIDSSENAIYIKPEDVTLFENSYLSLVSETFFYNLDKQSNVIEENAVFFSEKIFKPIQMFHPFIIASKKGSLEWLRRLGYRTFSPWIDETYDCIEDDNLRMAAIIKELNRLNKFSDHDFIEWQKNIKPIVEDNYRVLTQKKKTDYAIRSN